MTREFSFTGIAFRQNPQAPELFAFVASADDLKKICGVARKSEHMLTNYQRALDDDRVNREIAPFFRIPQNCSPTAIVLSLHSTPVAEVEFHDISEDKSAFINLKRLTVRYKDVDTLSEDDVVSAAMKLLDERLANEGSGADDSEGNGTEERPSEEGVETGEDEDTDEESTSDDTDDDVEENGNDDVEIGQSMLHDLKKKLEARESISPDLMATLRDMLRPALVIDGQHRLFGAAKVEEGIPLLVCSLVNPEWKEQVFQFTVINDKARGIPKPFITSLAGMSLTATELSDLQKRLSQAGVHLWEVEVMQRLGFDPKSPFFRKIEFKVTGSGSKGLGYQTMKQVGKAWFDPKSHGINALMRMLYAGSSGSKKSRKTLRAEWQKNEDWFHYFCCFWGSFSRKFEGTPLWALHSSLMTAVVLQQLQETFLTYLDSVSALTIEKVAQQSESKRCKEVYNQFSGIVDQFAQKFDAKHFPSAWGIKSLNHKDGKMKLQDYFEKVRQGKHVGNHPLRTGNVA